MQKNVKKLLSPVLLQNPAKNSITEYLNCTQAHARNIQVKLHRKGVLVKLNSGHMRYYPEKNEDAEDDKKN